MICKMFHKCSLQLFQKQSALPQLRKFSATSGYKEAKIKLLDLDINYIETLGNGQHSPNIFFMPGTFGSIEMDFKPIMHEFNQKKYKWISWDPPGYGKSRPPKREFMSERFESVNVLDVDYAIELMKVLHHKKYIILASSGAAMTGIIMANKLTNQIPGIITWGAFGYVSPGMIEMIPILKILKKTGLKAMPPKRRAQLVNMYGEEYLLEMWNDWVDEACRMEHSPYFREGGTYPDVIRSTQCPSLIIHGKKDTIVDISYAYQLKQTLPNSRLHLMENGTHNLHLNETKEFVSLIENFVDSVWNTK